MSRYELQLQTSKDLRDDVRMLGSYLGEILIEVEGQKLYEQVEKIRTLSLEGRERDRFNELRKALQSLSLEETLKIARAFSHFLTLTNIAEQHHRVRRQRQYQQSADSKPQRGSLDQVFGELLASGISKQKLFETVLNHEVELVLTAHPTEITRRTVLIKQNRIALLLDQLDRTDLTLLEKQEVHESLKEEILSLWKTDEIRRQKPTPLGEANSGLLIFEQTLWDAVPQYLRNLDFFLKKHTDQELPLDAHPIRFGSWMGGDRDGNPNVTPKVTFEVSLLAHWLALRLYRHEIDELHFELSMKDCSPRFLKYLEKKNLTPEWNQPYRIALKNVRKQIDAQIEHVGENLRALRKKDTCDLSELEKLSQENIFALMNPEVLLEPLNEIHLSLQETGAQRIAEGSLKDVIRRLHHFGMSLVRLDLRQESDKHTEALNFITESLGKGSYQDWDEEKRIAFLTAELEKSKIELPRETAAPEIQDVIDTFKVVSWCNPRSLGAYVISMAESVSDILAVEYLQKAVGVEKTLRVVPLFETVQDLDQSKTTLQRLFSNEWYRTHLKKRFKDRQEVMIGYSDSAKDSGRFTANWQLYKAQEEVLAVGKSHGIQITLFHGRGGSISRGGGPTYLAILSQPSGSITDKMRVTEQGEMIQAKFGIPGIAIRSLELYSTATLSAILNPSDDPKDSWRETAEEMSKNAASAYRELVRENPKFVEYFRKITPEVELSGLKIGSRPAKRKPQGGVESLRAIPWIFAWTQNRFLIPGWLGLNRALEKNPDLETLKEMYEGWPFFKSTLDLIEMVLAKADVRIASEYEEILVPDELKPISTDLKRDFSLAIELLKQVTDEIELLDSNPVLQRSIRLRNPYVDPINMIQIEILRRIRSGQHGNEDLLQDALFITFNGVAAGMRNTG